MKVEIKVSEGITEPYVVIHTPKMTEQIQQLAARLGNDIPILTAMEDERLVILQPEDITMLRVEEEKVRIYGNGRCLTSPKRLYELEEQLGCGFMRISKSVLINLKHIESVEPYFNGTMLLHLKNGCKDYISRKYLPDFKKYLGI